MKLPLWMCLFGLLFPNTLTANVISITDWLDTDTPTANYFYSIDDSNAGRFSFDISVPVMDADILGIAFAIEGTTYNANTINIQNFTAIAKDGSQSTSPTGAFYMSSGGNGSSCGAGCNFNGISTPSLFDVILRVGSNGGSNSNWIHTIRFDIDALGLTLADFTAVGVRSQSVLGNNSDKAYALTAASTSSTPISEPSTAFLLFFPLLLITLRLKPRFI
ncbi:hypothetical protein [Aliivibrio kagoshimensis]|uniref:hypothetical protein n=1 Tax=Aliivibrio kagoshimensis TaxID=2910230 RepID=UPI003D0FE160